MKVLVTGGAGFIGRDLIPRLVEAGHEVVATSRNPQAVIPGATVHQIGDLGPGTDWRDALAGVEAVIHLAARVHVMSDTAADPMLENQRVNTDGTAKLAADAINAGVQHFIFLSTIKVNGETTSAQPFRASDAPAPQDPYAIAKRDAEMALRKLARIGGIRLDIIRPPLVYGPGVRGNFLSLMKLCRSGLPLPLGAIKNSRSLIFVGNVSSLIVCLLKKPDLPGGNYLCRDGDDVSTPELLRRVAAALGAPARVFPFPLFLLRLAGVLSGKSETLSRLTDSLAINDDVTRQDLDWTPPFNMVQGLQKTADWYKSRSENEKQA